MTAVGQQVKVDVSSLLTSEPGQTAGDSPVWMAAVVLAVDAKGEYLKLKLATAVEGLDTIEVPADRVAILQ